MKTRIPQRKRLAGFSLVEMAIVLLITGILMGAGLSLLSVKQAAAQLDATQKHQETIKQALINYLGKNRRLPCPATLASNPPGSESRTGSPCANYSGIVPYAELGLDRSVALDGWENFITYVVSPNPIAAPPPLAAWLYTYGIAAPQGTSNSSLAFWPSNSSGAINITGTNAINGIVVALISYGKNGYGASTIRGTNSPPAGIDEQQNANPVSGVPPTVTVVKRDASDLPANPFDDVVMILSASDLTGPLIANGTLQANAQAALSQANDAVIGSILALRSNPCAQTCTSTSAPSVCTSYMPGPPVCVAYDTATPPNCTSYVPGPPVCATSTSLLSTCTSYTNACSYGLPSNYTFTSPPNAAAWGVKFSQGISTISASTTPSTGTAYTITAGDGSTKTVSIGELQGILSRSAGFN